MANPFPGMDPYMEQQWGDAHARIVVYASDQLQDVLPAGLKSRIEERVFVDSSADEEQQRQIVPDVRVVEHVRVAVPRTHAHAGVATVEPLLVEIDDVPLNLQSLVEQAHKRGSYDDTDYRVEPTPLLMPDDAGWADALLRAAGRR